MEDEEMQHIFTSEELWSENKWNFSVKSNNNNSLAIKIVHGGCTKLLTDEDFKLRSEWNITTVWFLFISSFCMINT